MAETEVKSVRVPAGFWARVEDWARDNRMKTNAAAVRLWELGLDESPVLKPGTVTFLPIAPTFSPGVEEWLEALMLGGMTRVEAIGVGLEEVLGRPVGGALLNRVGEVSVDLQRVANDEEIEAAARAPKPKRTVISSGRQAGKTAAAKATLEELKASGAVVVGSLVVEALEPRRSIASMLPPQEELPRRPPYGSRLKKPKGER